MKTDHELLELAAKAAGVLASPDGEYGWRGLKLANGPNHYWNPLADDGDALRLAVALGIQVTVMIPRDHMELGRTNAGGMWNLHGDDPCAATRRAIVRAAAEIGSNLLAAK